MRGGRRAGAGRKTIPIDLSEPCRNCAHCNVRTRTSPPGSAARRKRSRREVGNRSLLQQWPAGKAGAAYRCGGYSGA